MAGRASRLPRHGVTSCAAKSPRYGMKGMARLRATSREFLGAVDSSRAAALAVLAPRRRAAGRTAGATAAGEAPFLVARRRVLEEAATTAEELDVVVRAAGAVLALTVAPRRVAREAVGHACPKVAVADPALALVVLVARRAEVELLAAVAAITEPAVGAIAVLFAAALAVLAPAVAAAIAAPAALAEGNAAGGADRLRCSARTAPAERHARGNGEQSSNEMTPRRTIPKNARQSVESFAVHGPPHCSRRGDGEASAHPRAIGSAFGHPQSGVWAPGRWGASARLPIPANRGRDDQRCFGLSGCGVPALRGAAAGGRGGRGHAGRR